MLRNDMARTTRLMLAGAMLVGGAWPTAAQPERPPAYRAGVGLVQVPVTVQDAAGAHVAALPDDAFDLFENGRRMTLVDVQEVHRRDATDGRDYQPRQVIIVLDDLAIRPQMMPRAAQAARELLTRLDPDDQVALVNTSSLPDVRVEFTSGRVALSRAISRVSGQQDAGLAFGWQRARQGLAVLKGLLDGLQEEGTTNPRTTLVLFSEGYDIDQAAQVGMVDPDLLRDVRSVVGRAAQANVAIYAIDPAGLELNVAPFNSTAVRSIGPAAGMRRSGVSSSLSAIDDLSALAAIAHDTGGRLTRRNNDLLAQVPKMLADGDHYYLLTYEMPEATDRDRRGSVATPRQIDVRVRRADLTVRARQSYVHPRALAMTDGR